MLLNTVFRLLLNLRFPGKTSRRLVVLTYHRVHAQHDPLEPDCIDRELFELHIKTLAQYFKILKLGDAVKQLNNGTLPNGALCITFDDGYANNADVALPVLQKYQAPATFFIASGFINGGCMWNDIVIESVRRTQQAVLDLTDIGLQQYPVSSVTDKLQAIDKIIGDLKYRPLQQRLQDVNRLAGLAGVKPPADLMMNDGQIRQLEGAGMEIGGHTVNHPILTQIDIEQARREIIDNKRQLETIIGKPITTFAYPNGRPGTDYAKEHIEIVKDCGYGVAVTTAWGAAGANSDTYQIPRISSWDKSGIKLALRVLKTFFEKPGKGL